MRPSMQYIIAQPNEFSVLQELNILWTKSLDTVLELEYLQDFNICVIPGVLNPRYIIMYMLERYRLNVITINNEHDLLKIIIYTYINKTDKNICKMKFSNNMSFRNDILIICYLYEIISSNVQTYQELQIVNVLLELVLKKYGINVSESLMNYDPNSITLFNISYSFPSISLDMFNNSNASILQHTVSLFPNMYLPKMIFLPLFIMIYRILPTLSNPPIAILIAIYLKINDHFCSTIQQIPLAEIYSLVLANINCTQFPETLKIFLCKRWDIVTIVDGNYQFNSSFMLNSNHAKDLIRKVRELERSKDILGFEDILSKM